MPVAQLGQLYPILYYGIDLMLKFKFCFISIFLIQMQIDWNQDHMWDLILTSACLPPTLYCFVNKLSKINIFQVYVDVFFKAAILYPSIQSVIGRGRSGGTL